MVLVEDIGSPYDFLEYFLESIFGTFSDFVEKFDPVGLVLLVFILEGFEALFVDGLEEEI